jgi:hydroxyacylglutathione hydrolase
MELSIHPRVEQISAQMRDDIYVCLYLLRGEKNVVIDTGIIPAPERDLLPVLKRHGLALSDISFILNTHGHPDHIGGNARIKAAGGAKICIHKAEEPFLNDREHIFNLYSAPVFEAMGADIELEKKMFSDMAGPELSPDQLLEDNDLIDVGFDIKLKSIHLPGHSAGSIGFYWEKEGILFSGDAVAGLHIGGGKLPIILDLSSYKKSLKRLLEIPIRFLLCGHRYRGMRLPTASVRQGPEVGIFLRQSLELAERIDEAVINVSRSQYGKSFTQLVDEVIAQLPEEMGFMPITKVEMPFLTSQSIFFRLKEIGQQDV